MHLTGTAVTVLGPGPEDLQLMGYNLMAPERRRVVLESAVRTGLSAFAAPSLQNEPHAHDLDSRHDHDSGHDHDSRTGTELG